MDKSIVMMPVISSNVKSIGWKDNTLFVQFKSGALYRYEAVSEPFYAALVSADSKGKFLHANIYGRYEYERIA